MKRSRIILAIILIASLASSLLIYIYYRLVLTLPLIIVGIALLISQRWTKNKVFKLLSLNFGTFFSLAGVIFSGINLISLFDKEKNTVIRNQGDYGYKRVMLKGNSATGLGYAYPANLKNYSSKKVAYTINSAMEVVYDVVYNTDQLSNRYTPHHGKNILDKSDSILFLGDSLTFGEGLNDNETLSYFIQASTGRSALNAGMHGYGAHQALRILDDEDLFKKRTKGHKVTTIIYRPIVNHINRTAGYSPWDPFGPCYELEGKNTISFRGSFVECGKRNINFITQSIKILSSSSEPFTKEIAKLFTTESRYRNTNYIKKDVDKFVSIVAKMNLLAKSRGINFFVLLEDAGKYNDTCGKKVPFAHELEEKLRQQHLDLILTSTVYTQSVCTSNELTISKHDRHPNMLANKILAEHITKNNLIR